MSLRRLKLCLCGAQLLCAAASFTAAWQANATPDMGALAELERFVFWNSIVAIALMLFFLLWVAAVLLALFTRRREQYAGAAQFWKEMVPDVLLPPVFLGAGWLVFVLLQ